MGIHVTSSGKQSAVKEKMSLPPETEIKTGGTAVTIFCCILSLAVCCICALFTLVNVHALEPAGSPESAAVSGEKTKTLDLSGKAENYVNNSAAEALADLTYIKKIYTIDDDALCGNAPDPSCYGSSSDPDDVEAVISKAEMLLDGQELIWNRDIELRPDSEIMWYHDETILVIHWQEVIKNSVYNFTEVKIAHPSQFRRMLSDNVYGASVQYPLTTMAEQSKAVFATNGDFYIFRTTGINVYKGQVYNSAGKLDTCFIDKNGDLICTPIDTFSSKEEIDAFVKEKGISFSLNFGPVLVKDGEAIMTSYYPLGEVSEIYARSAIGQKGELHYLLMTAGKDGAYPNSATINDSAEAMAAKKVDVAYSLDGGQTAEQVMNGKILNRVVYDSERAVSDMIYFATALPEREG